MKVKTKNNRSLVAILVVLLLAFVGTTIAYHTSKGDFMNIFRTFFNQWTVTEEFVSPNDWQPCQRVSKTITAHNSGNSSIGVRIKYEEYWKRAGSTSETHETELPLQVNNQNVAQINLNTSHDWELRDDGYYYFVRPLASGETTPSFIDYVTYNCEVAMIAENNDCETTNGSTVCTKDQYDYDNAQYHLFATVEITDEPASYNVANPRKATLPRGANVNYRIKSIANPGQSFDYTSVADTKVRAIKMADALPANFERTDMNKFNNSSSEPEIRGWFEESTGTFYFYTEADYIEAPSDMGWTFQEFDSLTDISGIAEWRTHNVTKMNSLFSGCDSLTSIAALANWSTPKVTTLAYAFYGDLALSDISGLANWRTDSVTDMECLFYENTSLTNLDAVSDWRTSKVTAMGWLLWGASSITNLNGLRYWDTSSATAINSAFNGNTSLTDISGLADWSTGNVTNMGYLMYGAAVTNLDALANWDTRKVQYLDHAFAQMPNLSNLNGLTRWKTGNITTLASIFYGDLVLSDISGLTDWDTGNVTNMSWLFGTGGDSRNYYLRSLSALSSWDVRKVTTLYCAFYGLNNITDLNGLQNWQTNSLTDLGWAFANSSNISTISQIANWNVSHLTTIERMFSNDSWVRGEQLNSWSLPSGVNMQYAFTGNYKPTWYQG